MVLRHTAYPRCDIITCLNYDVTVIIDAPCMWVRACGSGCRLTCISPLLGRVGDLGCARSSLHAEVHAHAEDDVDFAMPASRHTGGENAREVPGEAVRRRRGDRAARVRGGRRAEGRARRTFGPCVFEARTRDRLNVWSAAAR